MHNSQASRLKLLLIEDEEDLAYQLQRFLIKRGFSVQVSYDNKHSLALIAQQKFDGVLFDRLLPDGDALDTVTEIKKYHSGLLLIMSALGRAKDRIAGFEQDVDYYLPKPIDLDELLAILELYERGLSKAQDPNNESITQTKSTPDSVWLLQQRNLISPNQCIVNLTTREALILNHLLENEGQVVPRAELIAAIHKDPEHYDPKALDSTMYRIRHKIESATTETVPLETVHGVGYVWQGGIK